MPIFPFFIEGDKILRFRRRSDSLKWFCKLLVFLPLKTIILTFLRNIWLFCNCGFVRMLTIWKWNKAMYLFMEGEAVQKGAAPSIYAALIWPHISSKSANQRLLKPLSSDLSIFRQKWQKFKAIYKKAQ